MLPPTSPPPLRRRPARWGTLWGTLGAALLVALPAAPRLAVAALPDGTPIINVHEHIESAGEADRLLAAMDQTGIDQTVLMGTSRFTITLQQRHGFTRVDWNNRQILDIARRHPTRFMAWPTIDPLDPRALERLQGYVAEGATGLKLYAGHGLHDQRPSGWGYFFHPVAMDHPELLPLYAWCEAEGLPIMFHVNPGPTAPGFAEEFITVLTLFPDLKVIAPHFILSSIKSSRLRMLLDSFPNLYSDMSFGHDDFLRAGLTRINRRPEKFRQLVFDYPDRFMFGTDVVVTAARQKEPAWIAARVRAYLDMLRAETYQTPVVPGQTLRGLALPQHYIDGILWRNFELFMMRRPRGTVVDAVEWAPMGIPYEARPLGWQLPRWLWKQKRRR